MSARARYADSVERQRLDLATVEQRIARARTLADRALDADDAAGADAALRAVARNEATRDDLAAADQQLADWRRALAAYRAIGDYVHGRIDRAEGIADLNVVLRGLL